MCVSECVPERVRRKKKIIPGLRSVCALDLQENSTAENLRTKPNPRKVRSDPDRLDVGPSVNGQNLLVCIF